MIIQGYISAGLWGIIGSSALIIGSFFGYKFNISKKVIAIITAFASGVLISAVCFEILLEAFAFGGLFPIVIGFITGVILFTLVDTIISRLNIKKDKITINDYYSNLNVYNKKEKDNKLINKEEANPVNKENNNKLINKEEANPVNEEKEPNLISKEEEILNQIINKNNRNFNKYQAEGLTTFASALLDGIPESIAIGLISFIGGPISLALITSIFISNLAEGTSASLHMKIGGWKGKNIIGIWIFVIIATAFSATLSYFIFSSTDYFILAIALSVTAGGILAMISSTMLPEAFEETQEYTGLIMTMGFLFSFLLSHLI